MYFMRIIKDAVYDEMHSFSMLQQVVYIVNIGL
jgi:hypothetical protein